MRGPVQEHLADVMAAASIADYVLGPRHACTSALREASNRASMTDLRRAQFALQELSGFERNQLIRWAVRSNADPSVVAWLRAAARPVD